MLKSNNIMNQKLLKEGHIGESHSMPNEESYQTHATLSPMLGVFQSSSPAIVFLACDFF